MSVSKKSHAAKIGYAEAKYQLDHIRFYGKLTEELLDDVTTEYIQRQFDICESTPRKQTQLRIGHSERKPMPADAFVGDIVFHKSFGTGIVTEADENKITVELESVGKKTFVNPDTFIDRFLYKPYST